MNNWLVHSSVVGKIYLYGVHQTLDFLLVQDRRDRSDYDLHRDIMNLLDAVRVNRPDVAAFTVGCAAPRRHYRHVSTGENREEITVTQPTHFSTNLGCFLLLP